MIEYYSVRNADGIEVKAFDTLEESRCYVSFDSSLTIVKVVM